jgi:FdhE protein
MTVSTPAASQDRWGVRVARARALVAEQPSAAEILAFYAELAEYQGSLARRARGRPGATLAGRVDVERAVAEVPDFLAWLQRAGPQSLADAAGALTHASLPWRQLMVDWLGDDDVDGIAPRGEAPVAFVVEAVLQPFAEAAALDVQADVRRSGEPAPARCPICSSAPGLGVLREDAQGARRSLVCARCLTEWPYVRVVCPACGEQQFDQLPVYTADRLPHVRVEACDACRRYLKTIDLTKNGLAVPLVDDLASVALDLWADEHGYRRLRPNLLRL